MKRRDWSVMMVSMAISSMAMAGSGGENNDVSVPSYNINDLKSSVYWEGAKPGGRHHGIIEVVSGTASADGNVVTGGSFEIDMNTISNKDIDNEGMRNKLVGHLKSDDFFSVEKYPSAFFVITKAKALSGSEHLITGNLTIRGNTHEISFPAEIAMDDRMIHAKTGAIKLDRTRWDVNYQSKSIFAELKDNFIADEMIVRLDIHLDRN